MGEGGYFYLFFVMLVTIQEGARINVFLENLSLMKKLILPGYCHFCKLM